LFDFDLYKTLGRNALNLRACAVLILIQSQKFATFLNAETELT